jgi:hypothetical protein
MHWVIQKSIFKPDNYQSLVDALHALGIAYTSISIPNGTFEMVPDVTLSGKVYVCGAIKLAKIAHDRSWLPASFLNENFKFNIWLDELGSELLNADIIIGEMNNINVSHLSKFFIRPLEDNKAFDGAVIDREMLESWKRDPKKIYMHHMPVVVSSVKEIYREYRLFVVNRKVITGSVYKVAGRPYISEFIEDYVIDYVNEVIKKWTPVDSFVIDIGLTDQGLKVIEFNNINSSGFYASDVVKYVNAIQVAYG